MQILGIFMAIWEQPVRPLSHLLASPVLPLCNHGASSVPPPCRHRRPTATNGRSLGNHSAMLLPPDWRENLQQNASFTLRPLGDHCASILQPRQCLCLPSASFEPPLSNPSPRRPLCDCFEHVQKFKATMASMTKSETPVYHL